MSRSEELAAKAARLRARQAPAAPPAPVSTSVPTDVSEYGGTDVSRSGGDQGIAPRVRPIRITVDLPPAEHQALARLALDAAGRLGLGRVHGQEVVRALVRRLLADPEMQAQIITDVGEARRTR